MSSSYYKPCPELDECHRLIHEFFETKQYEKCFEGHLPLARKGYPLAECQIGYFYLDGLGVDKDLPRAVYWTERAACHGDRDGQYNLAWFYENGIGVKPDPEKAKYWCWQASLQDHDLAIQKCRDWQINACQSTYSVGKWARQLIALQQEDGKWGTFHSMSQFYDAPLTTEQALRRLELLGFTEEDSVIQRALRYMEDCLAGRDAIPDHREKIHDWDVFTALILSTWIRRYTSACTQANQVARQWAEVITAAFAGGAYSQQAYEAAYRDIIRPNGGRLVQLANFYPVSLVSNCLDPRTEEALVDWLIHREQGIYYIYDHRIAEVPPVFESREASRYLAAVELLARYRRGRQQLRYVVDWLEGCKNDNGRWDMGKVANDKLYFPLSDDWRRRETREADCTHRISRLIDTLTSKGE